MEAAGMGHAATAAPVCWCGEKNLQPYAPTYGLCATCGTLVPRPASDEISLRDNDLERPDLFRRTRTDLPEVCMHWLQMLLRYKLPPARLLEIGSADGGFVALLRWAEYEATGLELNSRGVGSARQPLTLHEALEGRRVPEGSLDVILLNHVVERFPDPLATLGVCARLLKPDGILVVQLTSYPEDIDYEQLSARGDHFLNHLDHKADRRINLFSQRSARLLFSRLGFTALDFFRAKFDPYDIALVTSRQPLVRHGSEVLARTLTTPEQRMKLAWFDLLGFLETLQVDRAERLEVIQRLEATCAERLDLIQKLDGWLREALAGASAERTAREHLGAELRQVRAAAEKPAEPRKLPESVQKLIGLPRRALRYLKRLGRKLSRGGVSTTVEGRATRTR